MLEYINVGINKRYSANLVPIPSKEVLYDIIYGNPIDIKIAKVLARGSVLTNEIFSGSRPLLDPTISVQMLYTTLEMSSDLPLVAESFSNIVTEIKSINKYKGHSLEVIFREWFDVRATLALSIPERKMTVGTLLGLKYFFYKKILSSEAIQWLDKSIQIQKSVQLTCVVSIEESLYQSPTKPNGTNFSDSSNAYYEILKTNFPTESDPLKIIVCAAGDHQDFVLMTYSGDVNNPHMQGIDMKARTELMNMPTRYIVTKDYPDINHEKWKLFCEINGLPFKFIYLTTHPGITFYRDGILVMRRSFTSKFFGPMWETYLAARTVDKYTAPEVLKGRSKYLFKDKHLKKPLGEVR